MDKMRYFIIGNLIGFGVLIVGIGLNETIKHRAQTSSVDHAVPSAEFRPADGGSGDSTASAPGGAATVTGGDTSESTNQKSKDKNALPLQQKSTDQISKTDSEESSFNKDKPATIAAAALKTEKRLVTTRDISKGTILHPGDVELRQVDAKRASRDGLTTFNQALGEKTRIDLVEGEMLQPADLEDH